MFVPHINTLYRRIQSTHTAFLLFVKQKRHYTQLGNYILMLTKRMLNIAKNKKFVQPTVFLCKGKIRKCLNNPISTWGYDCSLTDVN